MRAVQWEVAAIVVKSDLFPVNGYVAGGAIGAKSSVMLVVPLVAVVAIGGCALVHPVLVTVFAGYFGVLPLQLEARQIVVETGWLPAIC